MNTILGELGKSKKFVELIKNIEEKQSPIGISGLSNVGMLETIASINEYSKKPIAIITYNEIQAKWIMENIQFFTDKAIYFPKKDIVTYDYVAESKDLPYSRIEALNKINSKRNYILVTTIEAAMQKLPAKQLLYKNTLKFKVGEIHSLDKIKQNLVNLGYTRCDLIEKIKTIEQTKAKYPELFKGSENTNPFLKNIDGYIAYAPEPQKGKYTPIFGNEEKEVAKSYNALLSEGLKDALFHSLKDIKSFMPELAPKMKEKNCLDYNSVEQYIDKLLEKVYTNEERKEILINLMKTYLTTVQQKNPELDIIGIDKQPINTQSKEERQ